MVIIRLLRHLFLSLSETTAESDNLHILLRVERHYHRVTWREDSNSSISVTHAYDTFDTPTTDGRDSNVAIKKFVYWELRGKLPIAFVKSL